MQFGENRFPVEIADDGAAASAFLEEVRLQEMIVKTVIKTVIKMIVKMVIKMIVKTVIKSFMKIASRHFMQ